jgi:hypothetical protein
VSVVVLAHAASTVFLAGVIWTIQVVHYPMFARVDAAGFPAAMADHGRRISGVVVGALGAAGATMVLLLARPPVGVSVGAPLVGCGARGAPGGGDARGERPGPPALGSGFDPSAHARLLATNWLRTSAWTAHAVLAVAILLQQVSS